MSGKRYKKRKMIPTKSLSAVSTKAEEPASVARMHAEFFSGPLPPPSLLAKYNDVIPNGAERILAMAERQSKHREMLEAQVIAGNLESQRKGSLYAFILAMTAILGGLFLIYAGKSVSGLVMIIANLVGLISIFVISQNKQSKERKDKSDALTTRNRK